MMEYPDLIELAEHSVKHQDWRKVIEDKRRLRAEAYERTTRKAKLKAAINLTLIFAVLVILWRLLP